MPSIRKYMLRSYLRLLCEDGFHRLGGTIVNNHKIGGGYSERENLRLQVVFVELSELELKHKIWKKDCSIQEFANLGLL